MEGTAGAKRPWRILNARVLQSILLIALTILVISLVIAMFCESFQKWLGCLIGTTHKRDLMAALGLAMGGVLVALQALMSYRRLATLEDTARVLADSAVAQGKTAKAYSETAAAQTDTARAKVEANKQKARVLTHERLSNAIEHLGGASESVRYAASYELFLLAQENRHLKRAVWQILCAHVRRTTRSDSYKEEHRYVPSEEIQEILNLLTSKADVPVEHVPLNLEGSWLNGAQLQGAWLQRAALVDVDLQRVDLRDASLHEASLTRSRLQGARLDGAKLMGVDARGTSLQCANLARTLLQGANLCDAKMQAARLCATHMEGAYDQELISHGESRILLRSGHTTQITTVVFSGGLNSSDVQATCEVFPREERKSIEDELDKHVGPGTYDQLDGIVDGSYGTDKAKEWMTKIPT